MQRADTPISRNRLCAEVLESKGISLAEAYEEGSDAPVFLVPERRDLTWLYERPLNGHKGTFGKVLVVAGSEGMCGAAYFCAKAALRSGAGMVKIQTAAENRIPLQQLLPEAMLDTDGPYPAPSWEKDMDWCDVIVAGCGLGTDAEAETRLSWFLRKAGEKNRILVLDADGLNLLARHPEWKDILPLRTVLTPHMGEMSRLTGMTGTELASRRLEAVRDTAERFHSVCVLKDACTVTAEPSGDFYVNTTGNDGMGTAGSGDVLAGILAGMLAQGRVRLSPAGDGGAGRIRGMQSMLAGQAACGVFLHGLAGDMAAENRGKNAMTATDIIEGLCNVELQFRNSGNTD